MPWIGCVKEKLKRLKEYVVRKIECVKNDLFYRNILNVCKNYSSYLSLAFAKKFHRSPIKCILNLEKSVYFRENSKF